MENLIIKIQCIGINNKRGTFLIGETTGKQYTKTFINCFELFNSIRYKELKRTYNIL